MDVLSGMGLSAVFGLLGIVIMAIGYIVFDKMIPLDFNEELKKGNLAVGVLIAGLLIGIAIVVSRVVSG